MPSRRRSFILVPLFVGLCAVSVVLMTTKHVSAASPSDDAVGQSMKSFTSVFDAVEQNFADKVDADKAVYNGAIPGMLRTLDPHSNFFDPKAYAALREDQRGQYYGVGMQVGPRNGKTMVMWPFETSPAYRAGLRTGDMIIQVDERRTWGPNWCGIASLVEGPRGTMVQVTVNREGNAKPITFDIIRDAIA